jgi:hypothetical protein
MMLQGSHLIYFKENVKVVYMEKVNSGGNGDIRKYCMKASSSISKHWEFAAKS